VGNSGRVTRFLKRHALLAITLGAYLLLGALFATRIPVWQAPDEPAHYNYVSQLSRGIWPKIEAADWDRNFQPIGPDQRVDGVPAISYQDHQPPLFYALGAPVFALTGGSLTALRLFTLSLSVLGVLGCYGCVLAVFPGRHALAALAATLYALLPQHLHLMSAYNNDALSEGLIALTLLQALRIIRPASEPSTRERVALAVTVGLALLSKAQAYLALPIAGLALLTAHWTAARAWPMAFRRVLLGLAVALVIGAPLWARNIGVYGGTDFLGLQAHDAVVIGQPTTAGWIAQLGASEVVLRMLRTTFQSFWGQFGWMSVVNDRLYWIALLMTFASTIAYLVWFWRPRRALSDAQNRQLTLLFVLLAMNLTAYAWYNQKFVQHQGRYLYMSLIPLSTAFALGWTHLAGRVRVSERALQLAALAFFAGLDVWLLLRVILPAMTPR
jgi:4-amino-4-deoxy-L-arabinose transferase-like glycosyltransferase